jgi:hypothetical protein
MFLGHFALGFAAKRVAPTVSLGTLFLAAQWLDLVWPTLLLVGVERVVIDPSLPGLTPLAFVHYPYTHSLLGAALLATALGSVHFLLRRDGRAALVIGALVVSHWLLDLVVHRADLPLLLDGGPRLGFGLWEFPLLAIAIELALFCAGVLLYLRATTLSRAARIGLAALVAFLLIVYAANLFGPPPPSVQAIAWAGQAQWLLVLAGYAIDRGQLAPAGRRILTS